MSDAYATSTYPRQCWHNRNVIDSVSPWVTHDEDCEAPVTSVVLVPTYGDIKGAGDYWPTLSCTEHLQRLMVDLTSDEGHGYGVDELIVSTVAKHKTHTSPIDGGPRHRSECDTCGTVLRLHNTKEEAERWATQHAADPDTEEA